ncbi:HD-GYP domain-containing protein [Alkalihalophilus marmarensis]|uniref:HD-GYP domain-containing protein n=1 Tax=Alkalihalophilus marmarensis TaxID=521377 RepID=UPI002E1BE3DA|nr:HD-GYP domain-containing protein [Alkalihalophilus marmarensis]
MKVLPTQLEEGCILSEAVMGQTDIPIIPNKTILSSQHISVLQTFLISSVEVESTLANGEKFYPIEAVKDSPEESNDQIKDQLNVESKRDIEFTNYYHDTVKRYKRLYSEWQSGKRVEIVAVKKCLIPFIEYMIDHPKNFLNMHQLSQKDGYMYHHAIAVACLAAFLAKKLHYPKTDWMQAGISGALADIGMMRIPNRILSKKGPLSSLELKEVQKHPIYSYNMLSQIKGISKPVLWSVLQHHERMDKSGYPLGSNEAKLHPLSQVVAVADVFHAMTSDRIYSRKQSPYKVIEHLCTEQFGKYDHRIVQTLKNSYEQLSIGMKVRLQNGEKAEIVFFPNQYTNNPMVRRLGTDEVFQLKSEQFYDIEEMI